MLESVLADVLTRVLGQYLEGIDRDSVRFGAWSGLVELRGVALRPEALAVLFETLGLDLPVTVEAGFIGLLRLQVPWNAIGTTPVQIHMEDITIMARPVRGDGSDDSELQLRERRIKRAKLDTDDAVREASWGVASDSTQSSWGNWLVSEELRAKIVDNIQIHLSDILLRFEDPFSDPRRPYIASVVCKSLRAVSANARWEEAFVERGADAEYTHTRKLLEVKGFRIDWAPITPRDAPGLSRGTAHIAGLDSKRFETPEMLKQFMTDGGITMDERGAASSVKSLLQPVDGSMRLQLSASNNSPPSLRGEGEQEPPVDLDIRFPNVVVDLDDVQYACILQTSVYFARVATRGYRPKTPRARWMWAIDQLLPGFSTRRERTLRFTEQGILAARDRRILYVAYRKSILKARRMAVEEPTRIAEDLEKLEDSISYEEVLALRDVVDRQIEIEGEDWRPSRAKASTPHEVQKTGTTISSFWQMLGYKEDQTSGSAVEPSRQEKVVAPAAQTAEPGSSGTGNAEIGTSIVSRVAFLLRGASIRLSENGFPNVAIPRVALNLRDFRVGVQITTAGDLIAEAVLGSIEAWDVLNGKRMVYSRFSSITDSQYDALLEGLSSAYPRDVSEAIDSIRRGSNPAKELLGEDAECSDDEDDAHLPGDQYFEAFEEGTSTATVDESAERKKSRSRVRSTSGSRDSTPSSSFRVTEAEFLGTLTDAPETQKYVAAFRYAQSIATDAESFKVARSKLDVSVATLEAVVDGPKGSFVWGLKFWQPKGMAQDPIMAFLGAAAGARIAELRMELEEALLANTVPMQINAVILAPRFILPSSSESSPAIVVNMGTLGICTSDNAPLLQSSKSQTEKSRIRYSNYVLTLDDLGVYFSPNLSTAVSQSLTGRTGEQSLGALILGSAERRCLDTTDVERIIRPLSVRFILQTLRDSNVVQVAHAPSASQGQGDDIAKVRVRGNIPGLYLILTQTAFQHLVVEARRWSAQLRPRDIQQGTGRSPHPSGDVGWQPVRVENESDRTDFRSPGRIGNPEEAKQSAAPASSLSAHPPTAMASYDVKVMVQKVSVELRDSTEIRLVTAVASRMCANIVKTGRVKLRANFSLQSWSVTDGSRGSTAAFRRLVYAGTFARSKGVSPPRSLSGTSDDLLRNAEEDKNFVNIEYTLDIAANEQRVHFQFLSLNMVCVRETYVRLASFFYNVHKKARKSGEYTDYDGPSGYEEFSMEGTKSSLAEEAKKGGDASGVTGCKGSMSIVSEFAGFNFQLIASGGAIAMIEMKDSKIHFLRAEDSNMKAWGDFRHFSVRDWTAPILEHSSVVTYEKPVDAIGRIATLKGMNNAQSSLREDEWTLSIPKSQDEEYLFRARFHGINFCFLYRFSVVIQQYFSVLQDGVQPVVDVVMEQVGDLDKGDEDSGDKVSSAVDRRARVQVDLEFSDLHVRVPRHSGCASEALTIDLSRVHIRNSGTIAAEQLWRTDFQGVDFAVDYVLPSSGNRADLSTVSSSFLKEFTAEMTLRSGAPDDIRDQNESSVLFISLKVSDLILIELCEAQYTVLYFVLTENLAETISGAEVSVDLDGIESALSSELAMAVTLEEQVAIEGRKAPGISGLEDLVMPQSNLSMTRKTVLDVDVSIPSLNLELSRGWDVTQERCKVFGLYVGNVKFGFTYRTPSQILFEATGKLLSIADLRPEKSKDDLVFAVPVTVSSEASLPGTERLENVTVSYEKESGSRAVVLIFLSGVQLQIAPELFRDLTYMAIPGWPYLETSSPAPDFEYLGRSMTVALSNSQVLLFSEEYETDRRALVVTGDFQLKMDWMKGTAAKRVSLRSSQLEVSTVLNFPYPERCSGDDLRAFRGTPFDKSETPLVYPTESFVEYVGPNVDEAGCRLNISANSILCLINAAEISLLRAVLTRPNLMKASYLRQRDWVQASPQFSSSVEDIERPNPKEEQVKKARENMTVSIKIPAARYLLIDERDGRFVPVLETRFKSFEVSAHLGNMVQVHGGIAMDLFNGKRGWWEPALEPWYVAASVSHGQSGTRAIVLKSESRLNVNITPTTVTAAMTVAKSLKDVTATRRSRRNERSSTQRLEQEPEQSPHEKLRDRPSVAAFLVRNELGLPITMSLRSSSRRTTIAHNSEVEVGVQTEDLLSSSIEGESKSRADALKCFLTIPRFGSQELSASEVGKHHVTFIPIDNASSREELSSLGDEAVGPVRVLWEVRMANGVPVCTVRSLYRIVNETVTALEVRIAANSQDSLSTEENGEYCVTLQPKETFSVPVHNATRSVQVRPSMNNLFDWSPSLPSLSWLYQNARETDQELFGDRSTTPISPGSKDPAVRCTTTQGGSSDFFITLSTFSAVKSSPKPAVMSRWLDVCLRAPIILQNSLPGPLSYRITGRFASRATRAHTAIETAGTVLAAGVIDPLKESHLHFSGYSLKSIFLSLAYDNSADENSHAKSAVSIRSALARGAPSRFGPEIRFEDMELKKVGAVLPSAQRTVDSKGQPRRDFRATVMPRRNGVSRYEVFSSFWIRNRSDSAVEVCSRGSYYGSGSQLFYLRERPPWEDPDGFVCLEGPYLSIRLPREHNSAFRDDVIDHSDWWTSPSMLEDVEKPLVVNLPGRSLEIDVRPALGLESRTSIITIRNSSWICNNTSSVLQWCQTSALDSHGNCITRLVNTLKPEEAQGIHWDAKSSHKAVHLRLAEENGQSDWIWSPAVPLNIGYSRELPAKMYRPKTHEQYIARVASKELVGDSRALVVYAEDRHNPPYRIVNLCRERALAFSQIGSHERPWLVRAGKTTRYSWDNPLAPPAERLLSFRVLEQDDLVVKRRGSQASSSSQRTTTHRHEKCNLKIDAVGDRVMVLSESYNPTVIVNVSVDGATKIVTFCDEDENGQPLVSKTMVSHPAHSNEEIHDAAVPTVGWDDIGQKPDRGSQANEIVLSDYPTLSMQAVKPKNVKLETVDTDAALFMDSIGISVITSEPSELMYICFKGVLVNYEAYNGLECLALHVRDCQVDNQLSRTPYPVLMWISPSGSPVYTDSSFRSDPVNNDSAIAVEVHRRVTDDDIVMIKSFQGAVRPFNICFEDEFVSKTLVFLGDTCIMGDGFSEEPLSGRDSEGRAFDISIPGGRGASVSRSSRQEGVASSRRIYVHEFRIHATAMRLTSSGSGAAVAKAAGINSSARALVALVLNVENCQFSFPSLNVQNVFDSLHHFTILVKEYYFRQLSNQRMKLLASNSFVGNPAALFDAVGTGARDFFTEPGRAKGSADFIASVGRGSKSLFTHTVGGLVESVSSIPRAVSSGLEKAVGDNEYLAERERIRGSNVPGGHRGSSARNPAQGLATGALSFAHGISSGVTGLIREPVQGARQGGAGGLLKGIGKAFIGGVAKPVAGAIDLVAEPAAGLSRQIAEVDRSESGQNDDVAIPERPPRAFRGRNKRLDTYDRRVAVGAWLYKAVQVGSGVSYESELLDWIELSDRENRTGSESELWVWNIVQRHSRSMPGTKKELRAEQRNPGRQGSKHSLLETRPEKIRVALVSMTDVVIATLDCKLVAAIPLWSNCIYKVSGQGKEVMLRTTMKSGGDSSSYEEMSGFLSGAQSLISAPWDAVSVGKRKRPDPGEEVVDRIPCGSEEARNDLCRSLRTVTKKIEEASERRWTRQDSPQKLGAPSPGLELMSMSKWEDEGGQELISTRNTIGPRQRLDEGFVANWTAGTRNEHLGSGNGSWVPGKERGVRDISGSALGGREWGSRARALSHLDKRIRRLSAAGKSAAVDKKGTVRVVIANKLENGRSLTLVDSSIEKGMWNVEPPLQISWCTAEVFEADCNPQASGSVTYRIDEAEHDGTITAANAKGKDQPQVMFELFDSGESTWAFTTRASEGFRADVQHDRGIHGTTVFTVHQTKTDPGTILMKSDETRERRDTNAYSAGAGPSGRSNRAESLSADELSLQQLVDIGFKFEDAIEALAEASGDMIKAVDILTR